MTHHFIKAATSPAPGAATAHQAPRALVIADSMETFLGVVRSLGRKGIEVHLAASADDYFGAHSRYVAALHLLPVHEGQPENWITALGEISAKLGFPLIVPCDDRAVRLLDMHRAMLAPARLALAKSAAIAVLADKVATRTAAARLAIPTARSIAVATPGDAAKAAAVLGFPLVIKPRQSFLAGDAHGKTMARIFANADEVARFSVLLSGREWIAEEFVAGTSKGVSVLASRGEILTAWQHRRISTATQTGASSIRMGEPVDARLLADCAALARDTMLHGVAMFEFRVADKAGRHVLIEVNPRFWGSLPAALAAGFDFPAMLWELLDGQPVTAPQAPQRYPLRYHLTGEYQRRTAALDDADEFVAKLRAGRDIAALLARLCLAKGTIDTFASDDPAPFRAERRWIAASIARAIGNRLRSAGTRFDRARQDPQ